LQTQYKASATAQELHVRRAAKLVGRSANELLLASQAARDRYNRNRLRFLARGLQQLEKPLSIIAGFASKVVCR
jgi:hypothetical protein